MATPSAIAKRTEKRQIEILEVVNDLKAAFLEIAAARGEVFEANIQADELQAEMVKTEIYGLKQQVAELSGQIAEFKKQMTSAMKAPATRTKK